MKEFPNQSNSIYLLRNTGRLLNFNNVAIVVIQFAEEIKEMISSPENEKSLKERYFGEIRGKILMRFQTKLRLKWG